ncbi:hypothetical protein KDJ56_22065 (plasmid) [Brevibacillus composti]|uniref:Uncharacterized protein n=1 Tax=Brevibacillus composti TaxID=2796470 RepID=A0A7T5JQQ4_9BACL|nr:hypothetical protein [Brevibacillus composti]QQE76753.1 hypothetical protein JD108_22145 [Brevibacillus composti]QUO43827.1 hypothetical protein KDJ56_22065 [Brevibacillus composti]
MIMIMVSNAEIEKLFGWKKGKAGVYAGRNILPNPVQVLSCGRLWNLEDILFTAAERGWEVNQEALREIHKSVVQSTPDTKEVLQAEINSMRNHLRSLQDEIEKKQKNHQDLDDASKALERQVEQQRAKLVFMQNEVAERETKVDRLRDEEKRLDEWITVKRNGVIKDNKN